MSKKHGRCTVSRQALRRAYRDLAALSMGQEPQGRSVEIAEAELSRKLCLLAEAQALAVTTPGLTIVPAPHLPWRYEIRYWTELRAVVGIESLPATVRALIEELEAEETPPFAPVPHEEMDGTALRDPITEDHPLFQDVYELTEQIWDQRQIALDILPEGEGYYTVASYDRRVPTRSGVPMECVLAALRAILAELASTQEVG